jgi:hypothetical protein
MIFTIIQASGIIFTMELTDENRVGFQSLLHSEGYDGSVCAGKHSALMISGSAHDGVADRLVASGVVGWWGPG